MEVQRFVLLEVEPDESDRNHVIVDNLTGMFAHCHLGFDIRYDTTFHQNVENANYYEDGQDAEQNIRILNEYLGGWGCYE